MNQKQADQQVITGQYVITQTSEQEKEMDSLFAFYNQLQVHHDDSYINQQKQYQGVYQNQYYCNQMNQIPQEINQEQLCNQQEISYTQNAQNLNQIKFIKLKSQKAPQQQNSFSTYTYQIQRKKRQYNSQNAQNSVNKSLDILYSSRKQQTFSNKLSKIKNKTQVTNQNSSIIFCDPNKNIGLQQNKGIISFDSDSLLNVISLLGQKIQGKFSKYTTQKNQPTFKDTQRQLNQMLANLGNFINKKGIKTSNKLGKSKTEREINNICIYLRGGSLPKDYLDQFKQLLSK